MSNTLTDETLTLTYFFFLNYFSYRYRNSISRRMFIMKYIVLFVQQNTRLKIELSTRWKKDQAMGERSTADAITSLSQKQTYLK